MMFHVAKVPRKDVCYLKAKWGLGVRWPRETSSHVFALSLIWRKHVNM